MVVRTSTVQLVLLKREMSQKNSVLDLFPFLRYFAILYSFLTYIIFALMASFCFVSLLSCRYYQRIHFNSSSVSNFCASGQYDSFVEDVHFVASSLPSFSVLSDFDSYHVSPSSLFSYDGTSISFLTSSDHLIHVFLFVVPHV